MDAGHANGLPASFFELVRVSEVPVLVDFWAEWCGPCRIVSPTIERLARENHGRLLTVKVNVDRRPQVAQAYEIQGVPTIMLFWKGEAAHAAHRRLPLRGDTAEHPGELAPRRGRYPCRHVITPAA